MSRSGDAEHERSTAVRVGCRELALACVMVSVVTGLLGWVAVSAPWVRRRPSVCRSNLHMLSMSLQMYAEDHGDRLPPAGSWQDAIFPDYIDTADILKCPDDDRDHECSYAMSRSLSAARLDDIPEPPATPLLWDAEYPTEVPSFRHDGHLNAVHADGRAARMSRSEFEVATQP